MSVITTSDLYKSKFFLIVKEACFDHQVPFDDDVESLTTGTSYLTYMEENWDSYFVNNLFKKVENVDFGLDPINKAKVEFISFILWQNSRSLFWRTFFESVETRPDAMGRILRIAKMFITDCLKDFSILDLNMRHSTGSTSTVRKTAKVVDEKLIPGANIMSKTADVGGLAYLYNIAEEDSNFGASLKFVLDGIPHKNVTERVSSLVPISLDCAWKNAKTGRVIGPNETYVVALQNAIGDALVQILIRHCGIDMATAQDIHKAIVLESSLTGEFSTLDLKGGSNNITQSHFDYLFSGNQDFHRLVRLVCPTSIEFDEKHYNISMLALQGNGLIMALQTFTYYAIIHGVQRHLKTEGTIKVFGDDIICQSSIAESVIKTFNFLDLTINVEKSFINPPFLESCGMDAIYGNNIRPLYVKYIPQSIDQWIRVANGIRRVCYYNNAYAWRSAFSRDLWKRIVRAIPQQSRLYVPRIYGDSGINIESSFLYTFRKPKAGDAEYCNGSGGVRYPNNGFDSHGNPFWSEFIKIRANCEQYQSSFGTELKGLKADIVQRLVSDPSLRGAGWRFCSDSEYRYPLLFNSTGNRTQFKWVPYTGFVGRAPDDNVDDLFEFLKKNGNEYITDSNHIVSIYENRLTIRRREVISALRSLVEIRRAVILEVQDITFEL